MADSQTLAGTLEIRYEPDSYSEQEIREGASWQLGAGHYTIGVNVDGAFFPIQRLKGGGVQKKLAAAKQAREQQAQQAPTEQSSTPEPTPAPTPEG